MAKPKRHQEIAGPDGTSVPPAPADFADQPPAWEEIENGRYMPRRIRGSCRGRELG